MENTIASLLALRSSSHAKVLYCGVVLMAIIGSPNPAGAQVEPSVGSIIGVKIRAGGRYDNVRMCVATPAGVKGGRAADISLFTEFSLSDNASLHIDLPVFRPILFGLAFKMLQFEPSVTLKFRKASDGNVDFVAGPMLGLSLHYGPDFNSEPSGDSRSPSFFALGPTLGGYMGLDFKRPGKTFNVELGLTPYITTLFGVGDAPIDRGIVAGGLLDVAFKFDTPR